MKKYLLVFILLISKIAFAENKSSDSIFYRHTFSIRPISFILLELRATYRYQINSKSAIELNFAAPVSYIDKYSKQQYPLSFQWNDGWVEPFSLPTTIGIKYCLLKKEGKNGLSQIGFGYNYKTTRNATMTFGGGDAGYIDVLYSQWRNEFIFDYTYFYEKKISPALSLKFFCGIGVRFSYNKTVKEVSHAKITSIPQEGYIGFAKNNDAIHNENGLFGLPLIYFGLNFNFNFHKIRY